ncbi:MAG: leucine-rich repeat domain-containing protein [Oscillospiraceae bacterium]|nr:leucine-rich repeat domain-containing protein [Oscillospiraceae bacterium]
MKKTLSILLITAILVSSIPLTVSGASAPTKQYVLFAAGENALQLNTTETTIVGNVYTGGDLNAYSIVDIDGKAEAVGRLKKHENNTFNAVRFIGGQPYETVGINAETGEAEIITEYSRGSEPREYPHFTEAVADSLGDDFVTHQWWQTYSGTNVANNAPVYAQSGLQFTGNTITLQDTIISENHLLISASNALTTVKNGEVNLLVKNGNIGIHVESMALNGIIYAPNGTVQITGTNININGVIIAKEILISATNFAISENPDLSLAEHILSGIVEPEPAEFDVYGNLFYTNRGDSVIIEGLANPNIKNVVIPDKIGGFQVMEIAAGAFMDTSITSVTLPESLRFIGKFAFSGATELAEITIPAGVTSIGDAAFESSGISSVTFVAGDDEEGLSIGMAAFAGCAALTSIALPDRVLEVGAYGFTRSGLVSVEIGAGITSIPAGVFEDCEGLVDVIIPDNVERIGDLAFANCVNLGEIDLPDGAVVSETAFYIADTSMPTISAEICTTERKVKYYNDQDINDNFRYDFVVTGGINDIKGNLELPPHPSPFLAEYVFVYKRDQEKLSISGFLGDIWGAGNLLATQDYVSGASNIRVTGDQVSYFGWCERGCGAMCVPAESCSLGHLWGEWETTTAAACYTDGLQIRFCSHYSCTTTDTRPIEKGHIWLSWRIDIYETCDADGIEIRNCFRLSCDEYETRPIDAMGHLWGINWTVTVAATCTTDGVESRVCLRQRCTDIDTQAISAFGHSWGDNWETTRLPTVDMPGIQTRKCMVEDCYEIQTSEIPMLGHPCSEGHLWGEPEIEPASCSTPGESVRICNRCDEFEPPTTIPPLGHDWGAWVETLATCEEQGERFSVCLRCEQKDILAVYPELGHDMDYLEVVEFPTCFEEGVMKVSCTRCAEFELQPIDKAQHVWRFTNLTRYAVKNEPGELGRECNNCDAKSTVAYYGYKLGDIDGNAKLDIFDVLEILKYITKFRNAIQYCCDLYNCPLPNHAPWVASLITPRSQTIVGEPTIFDVLEILKFIVGMPSEPLDPIWLLSPYVGWQQPGGESI